ncbi:MAG: hypothetical protein ACRC47_07460 [Shewanella sp.]
MKTQDQARTYSGPITRERQKETGEIFTPLYMVDKMIDMLGAEALELGFTVLEPAAGDGNFVARIIERKIRHNVENGIDIKVAAKGAVSDVYACEYMKDNHNSIIRRIGDLLVDLGVFGNKTEWNNSGIRHIVRRNVAYCNTLDPWDESEGRIYPSWMVAAIDDPQWEKMKKKSKNYKTNKGLFDRDCEKVQGTLDFLGI